MTSTTERDLDRIKMNYHAKRVCQKSLRSKAVVVRTNTHTRPTD